MSKIRFYNLKNKDTGKYKGVLMAENEEKAFEVAFKNNLVKEEEKDSWELIDITQGLSKRDKFIQG